MKQITIFDNIFGTDPIKLFKRDGPDTSEDAAKSLDTSRLEQIVYEVACKYPNGCILEDFEKELSHMRVCSISPRISTLIEKGYLMDTGERKKASSGRNQRIIKVVKP